MYFVRSRVRTIAMLEPEVIDREVVAVSFDSNEIVRNIERFGLEDGQVVQLSRRVTDSSVANTAFLRQLLGGFHAEVHRAPPADQRHRVALAKAVLVGVVLVVAGAAVAVTGLAAVLVRVRSGCSTRRLLTCMWLRAQRAA